MGVPKKGTNKTNKNGQTWQACQNSKVVQRGLKGSEMVNPDVFDHLGPFGPFQTKNGFLLKITSVSVRLKQSAVTMFQSSSESVYEL